MPGGWGSSLNRWEAKWWVLARALAADWGARAESLGARGHINAESGLGDWPEGWARLLRLQRLAGAPAVPS